MHCESLVTQLYQYPHDKLSYAEVFYEEEKEWRFLMQNILFER